MGLGREIVIDGKIYVEKSDAYKETEKAIIVCDRGWVVVGNVAEDDQNYFVTNAKVFRRWGTKKGLGEVAKNGPLENTKLDDCGDLKILKLTTIMKMSVDSDAWK